MIEIVWNIAAAIGALMLLPIAAFMVAGLIGAAVAGFVFATVSLAEWHERRTKRKECTDASIDAARAGNGGEG